jgi:hypothetical protein
MSLFDQAWIHRLSGVQCINVAAVHSGTCVCAAAAALRLSIAGIHSQHDAISSKAASKSHHNHLLYTTLSPNPPALPCSSTQPAPTTRC